ncbi:MAG: zinc metalloprotease HtpX [Chloroflexi bacterium]|nr:zinc metalloprotease HtpX [Chloroflexota bacterium]
MFVVLFLLTAVYLAFLIALWQAGLELLPLALVAVVLAASQYFLSDKLVLWSTGARIVSPTEAPELHARLERLAALADIPKPQVAIVRTDVPNAFAAGRSPSSAVIAVTTGLLDRLDPPEVEAVLAHELSHVRNRDVAIITIASFLSTVAYLLMRFSMFGGYSSRRRDRGNAVALVYLASIVVWVVSFFLIRALSRYREYAADRGSAYLTGAPSQLAAALLKISGTMARIPQRDLREMEGMNAFYIIPALSGSGLAELFSTHPALENRLRRLQQLELELEGR